MEFILSLLAVSRLSGLFVYRNFDSVKSKRIYSDRPLIWCGRSQALAGTYTWTFAVMCLPARLVGCNNILHKFELCSLSDTKKTGNLYLPQKLQWEQRYEQAHF